MSITAKIERLNNRSINFILGIFFILNSFIYYICGVRFDTYPLIDSWQNLDIEMLRNNLMESLLYLHSQPPLYNLFLGILLKVFPVNYAIAAKIIFLFCGLTFYLCLFWLQVKLKVSKIIAFILSSLFICSPTLVYYENSLSYTLLIAMLILLSCIVLQRMLESKKQWYGWTFFFILFIILGMRSMFHISFFILIIVTIAWMTGNWKKVLLCSVLPLLLIFSLHMKNYMLFGKFTTSTWLGMNFWDSMELRTPQNILDELIDEGSISSLAKIKRFSELEAYPEYFKKDNGEFNHIPALSEPSKSTGNPNFNHLAYIGISDQYLKDALQIYKRYPFLYIKRIIYAWVIYFKSGSDYFMLTRRSDRVHLMENIYDYCLYGKLPIDTSRIFPIERMNIYLFLLIGLPLVVIYCLKLIVGKRKKGIVIEAHQRITLTYMLMVILYIAIIGNSFEFAENNRFRFATDPLSLVIFGLLVQNIVNFMSKKRHNIM